MKRHWSPAPQWWCVPNEPPAKILGIAGQRELTRCSIKLVVSQSWIAWTDWRIGLLHYTIMRQNCGKMIQKLGPCERTFSKSSRILASSCTEHPDLVQYKWLQSVMFGLPYSENLGVSTWTSQKPQRRRGAKTQTHICCLGVLWPTIWHSRNLSFTGAKASSNSLDSTFEMEDNRGEGTAA